MKKIIVSLSAVCFLFLGTVAMASKPESLPNKQGQKPTTNSVLTANKGQEKKREVFVAYGDLLIKIVDKLSLHESASSEQKAELMTIKTKIVDLKSKIMKVDFEKKLEAQKQLQKYKMELIEIRKSLNIIRQAIYAKK